MHVVVEYRFVISLALSVVVGVSGLQTWPFPYETPILGLIAMSRPMVYASFCYAYATVWFSTPFFLFNIVLSLTYISWHGPIVRHVRPRYRRIPQPRVEPICFSCSANSTTTPPRCRHRSLVG
jgi:hypothetical protein